MAASIHDKMSRHLTFSSHKQSLIDSLEQNGRRILNERPSKRALPCTVDAGEAAASVGRQIVFVAVSTLAQDRHTLANRHSVANMRLKNTAANTADADHVTSECLYVHLSALASQHDLASCSRFQIEEIARRLVATNSTIRAIRHRPYYEVCVSQKLVSYLPRNLATISNQSLATWKPG